MYKKAKLIFFVVFGIQAVLLITHKGEFWPFSIYPMFSQAGKPWTKTLIRTFDTSPSDVVLTKKIYNPNNLPGEQLNLSSIHVNQNDIANYFAKQKTWNSENLRVFHNFFKNKTNNKYFIVYKVTGQLKGDDVLTEYTPYIKMDEHNINLIKSANN